MNISIPSSPLLTIQDLSVIRGERLVLDNVNLTLNAGEAMLLTGPNGAGKSTLLRTIAGLRRPTHGQITCNTSLAWLGHQDALKPALTLKHNLALSAQLSPYALDEILLALDLSQLADMPARLLSSGQKRRAAFARIMLSGASLWLLDEPSVGLDHASIERLGTIMAQHRAQGGALIATTHVPLPLPNSRTHQLPVITYATAPLEDFDMDILS